MTCECGHEADEHDATGKCKAEEWLTIESTCLNNGEEGRYVECDCFHYDPSEKEFLA